MQKNINSSNRLVLSQSDKTWQNRNFSLVYKTNIKHAFTDTNKTVKNSNCIRKNAKNIHISK